MSRLVVTLLSLLLTLPVAAQQASSSERQRAFLHDENAAVPMRDGVLLRADALRPAGDGKFPTLVYRTPYGRKEFVKTSVVRKAVERGFAIVVQDVRGRYGSEGEFVPYVNEGRDGFDTIEWAARQPWSDGNVGTFGLSYPGAVQWLAAVESPPHLKAMIPGMTFSTPRNFFYYGGIFEVGWIGWISTLIAPDVRRRKDLPGPRTYEEASAVWRKKREEWLAQLPLASFDELKGIAPYYYEWMKHPAWSDWWEWAELRGKYSRVNAAVLNFSSWHDDAYGSEGATTNFMTLMRTRPNDPPARTQLIMGPWFHGTAGMREQRRVGARDMGPEAVIDYDELVLSWMDRHLRGRQNAVDRRARVRSFLMGANLWREYESWPPPSQPRVFYFGGDGKRTALISNVPEEAGSAEFLSDAARPVTDPHYFGAAGANDYRELVGKQGVLTFDSEPLAHDLEVTGYINAEIYFSADVPDFDLWVRVLDVAPDGTAFNLMAPGLDAQRASYRNQSAKRELLRSSEVYKLEYKNLLTSNLFKKGHRVRVQISGAFFPNLSRNLQTGELEMVSAKTRAGKIEIHFGGETPSQITLPIVKPAPSEIDTAPQ